MCRGCLDNSISIMSRFESLKDKLRVNNEVLLGLNERVNSMVSELDSVGESDESRLILAMTDPNVVYPLDMDVGIMVLYKSIGVVWRESVRLSSVNMLIRNTIQCMIYEDVLIEMGKMLPREHGVAAELGARVEDTQREASSVEAY